jgi:SAM-dependent methyltransferase
MSQKEIRRYLNVIKRAVSLIEGMLDNDDGGLLESLASMDSIPNNLVPPPQVAAQTGSVPISAPLVVQQPVTSPEQIAARKKHIEDLMAIDCWPEAVPQFLVAKDASVEDQINRANAVLDMMLDRQINDLDFLDFGCGDGWIAQQVTKRGVKSSTGFDIKPSLNWNSLQGVNFTSDYNNLRNNQYDVIMLYDVLDHCHDPVTLMSQIKFLLKPDGVVFVRCHPWVSRHATHLYKQGINKSYLHLFLTYDEIKALINQEPTFTRSEKDPINAYHWWFGAFEIKKERFVREPVSDFFHVPSFKELLANEQQIPPDQIDEFLKKMEIQFVDYKLQAK